MFEFLRPKVYRARYPRWLVGKPLLLTSSLLCSLGDAMFGYSQGCISTALVQPSFIRRMYGVQDITLERIANGDTGVNEYLIGTYDHLFHLFMLCVAFVYFRPLRSPIVSRVFYRNNRCMPKRHSFRRGTPFRCRL